MGQFRSMNIILTYKGAGFDTQILPSFFGVFVHLEAKNKLVTSKSLRDLKHPLLNLELHPNHWMVIAKSHNIYTIPSTFKDHFISLEK